MLAAAGGREHAATRCSRCWWQGWSGSRPACCGSSPCSPSSDAAPPWSCCAGGVRPRSGWPALVGAQAAAAAVPGAAVGYLVGMLVPGRSGPTDLVLPAALTLGAVALMVLAGARVHGGRTRRAARFRWVGELLVLARPGSR